MPYGSYLALASFQIPEPLHEGFRLPQTGLDGPRTYQQLTAIKSPVNGSALSPAGSAALPTRLPGSPAAAQ